MNQERSWIVATRVALWLVAALFAALLATGIALTFRYSPDVSSAYANPVHIGHSSVFTARRVHRLASVLFVPAVGALAISSIVLFLVRRRRAYVTFPLVAGFAALVASFTGYLLPWDQLGLWAVTVGTNIQGYTDILSGRKVKFVLLGSRETTTATLGRWYWLHAVVVPLVLIVAVIAIVFASRRERPKVS